MAHTHEYDCIVCGEHFDKESDLWRHNEDTHAPKEAIDTRAPAEPMGTERPRQRPENQVPPHQVTGDKFPTPRYGSAASGGLEYEPGPERD